MRINDKHIFTLSGELIQGRGNASHEMLLGDNSETIPIGRGFVHGHIWNSPYPNEGTTDHYLNYAINDNIGMSDMNYTYMGQKAKPKHYEPALRTLLQHYSQNPERKFKISLGIGDEEDPSHPVVRRYKRATGREAPSPFDGFVDLTSIDDIKNFIGKSKAEIKRKRLSRELPAVDTSRLGREPSMPQGNMTTAEWNFWRRKGLGDSYIPIMTFKEFILENKHEKI